VAAALLSKPAQAWTALRSFCGKRAIESLIRKIPMLKRSLLSGLALAISLSAAFTAQADNEQYFPLQSYRVGPYAAGGSGFFGGFIDYLKYVNANGGVNGVKLTWSECETEYVVEKGVECYERLKKGHNGAPAAATNPLSVGIAYATLERSTADKSWPRYRIRPCTTSPRSALTRLDAAFNVVLLPAPLAPNNTTICPCGTARDTPRTARIACS